MYPIYEQLLICSYVEDFMQKLPGETLIIEEEHVSKIKKNLMNEKELVLMSDLFKVVSDPTRIKILCALEQQELCVYDISVILNMTQSAISHQLRVLRDKALVKSRKEGKTVFYSLKDDHVQQIFRQTLEHIHEDHL